MTSAIQSTVAEFLAPPPPKNTIFSPSRIRQNILSRQLNDHDVLPTIRDSSPDKEVQGAETDGDLDGDGGDSSSTTLPPDSPPIRLRHRTGSCGSSNLPHPDSITVDTLEKHMYTSDDPPLDLFIRTSGVERLSDFMLWQCHQDTQIFFLDCLWPDFDLHHFIWVLLEWQWRLKKKERDQGVPNRGRPIKTRKVAE
jgi:ditrans,polycis-polyprenyl diphosphate synthase